jgi:hypothetical protein
MSGGPVIVKPSESVDHGGLPNHIPVSCIERPENRRDFLLDFADSVSSDAIEQLVQTSLRTITPSFTIGGNSRAFHFGSFVTACKY